ncbi:hypothetical protein Tfer_2093 [Thermincola ferriacetica]|uniref:Uncharacterized protein n=2 Tax=Thermincola TaxID=278993 RepID=D5XDY7_THEPJ|nr:MULTISPECIES: hypothetical protein [Thermincola]ADG81858.1 hypothetical protein TherJR_0993 [Thermincola potens JR]KNZ69296.1 hypothetical protein Tfer_2093 [Thermincola ferriacetica]
MLAIFGLIVVGCLVAAYFQKGWNRYMLILLAIAIVQLKSLAIGMKIFSLTAIAVVLIYFLRPRKK